MINEIKFNSEFCLRKSYPENIPFIKSGQTFKFTSGVNVVLGGNGSGKSTLLNILADLSFSKRSGSSVIDKKGLLKLRSYSDQEDRKICSIKYDGYGVVYIDSRSVGSVDKFGNIDQGLFGQGILEVFNSTEESTGECSRRRVFSVLSDILNTPENSSHLFNISVDNRQFITSGKKNELNEIKDLHSQFCEVLPPHFQKPTIILDEPENGMDALSSLKLFDLLLNNKDIQDRFQLIIVSHDRSLLGLRDVNYIELEQGYHQACLELVNKKATKKLSKITKNGELTASQKRILLIINNKETDNLKLSDSLQFLLDNNYVVKRKIRTSFNSGRNRPKRGSEKYTYSITQSGQAKLIC